MEKIINHNIISYLIKNNLIDPAQFGFLPKSSTVLQLISNLEEWYGAILQQKMVDTIYIDFSKAFDRVPFPKLITKLKHYGVQGKILKWIEIMLTTRNYRVKINENLSAEFPIKSGVPQGSPLGPTFFLIYINDLPKYISPAVKIRLYADDLKLMITHNNCDKVIDLQNALNQVVRWSKSNHLPINISKTYVFRQGKGNMKYNYTIDYDELPTQTEVKDLGVLIDEKLGFELHILNIVKNAYFKTIQLLRIMRTKKLHLWSKAFKSYVRPILEYASQIWNPYKKTLINKIEKVQRFFTRKVLFKCKKPYMPYEERLTMFQLESLEHRRKVADLTLLFKIVKNQTSIAPTALATFSTRPSRKHQLQIIIKHRNNKTKNSFINRTSNEWNALNNDIENIQSSDTFKRYYNLYLSEISNRNLM